LNYCGGFFIVDFLREVCYKEVSEEVSPPFNVLDKRRAGEWF